MKLILSFLFVLALALPLFSARADEKPYGYGGCGLGSMITGPDGSQIIAMTTNSTSWETQTFAMSSGTSNCVDEGTVRKRKRRRAFLEGNQQQLSYDISKGQGESIAALADLYHCTDSKVVGESLQKHFTTIFPDSSVSTDHVESAIDNVISTELKKACLG